MFPVARPRRAVSVLTTVRYKGHLNFYQPMRPVSEVRFLNPLFTIPNKLEDEPRSHFYDESIVTEKSALEEVLFRRLNEKHYKPRTPEEKAENRIFNRLETQRLKRNAETVWDRVQTIHEDMRITGVKPTVKIYMATVSALVQCTRIDKAHEMMTKMKELFPEDEIPGSIFAYMIQACFFTQDFIRAQGYMSDLLRMLSSETRKVPREDPAHVLRIAFNNLINLYSQANDVEKVESTFTQMRASNLQPNERTYENVLKVYANTRKFDKAVQLVESMEGVGRDENNQLKEQFSRLLIKSCPPEQIDQAVQIFDNMPSKDWRTYNEMMEKYRQAKQYNKAYELYERIRIEKVKIRQPIFATLLNVCYSDGLEPKSDFIEELKQKFYGKGYVAPKSNFDMHRIRKYWREIKEVYRYKEREPIVKEALERILQKRKEDIKVGEKEIARIAVKKNAKIRSKIQQQEVHLKEKQEQLRDQLANIKKHAAKK
jgi:pentatricopeptide repeat protein